MPSPLHMVFIQPADDSDAYYQVMTALMRRAADQFGIQLEILSGARRTERVRRDVAEVLGRTRRPDYLLAVNDLSSAVELVPEVCNAGIPLLMTSQELLRTERFELGEPGERHPHWIGSLVPDDAQAGRLLAAALIDYARGAGLTRSDGKVVLSGIGGAYTAASIQRITGMRQVVAKRDDAELGEMLPGSWDRARAAGLLEELLRRVPDTSAIWAADDSMALGAVDALKAAGRQPGVDILVGGVDWEPAIVEPIATGEIAVSVGGHFLEGARAVVVLYDHHHGFAFEPAHQLTSFTALDTTNLDRYRRLLDETAWGRIDFTRFSRARHPEQSVPTLDVDSVVEQL